MSDNSKEYTKSPDNKSSEVDLGDLFKMMGRGIKRFFSFLRDAILFILDLLIKAMIIIRLHILKFIVVGVLAAGLGWLVDAKQPVVYGSSMVVETNYGSAPQLYSNIRYYNALIQDRDTVKLAEIFSIDEKTAAAINSFFIDPSVSENTILKSFDEYLTETDTIVKKSITYQMYKDNTKPSDFGTHTIVVTSLKNKIFPKLQKPIVETNIDNEYVKARKTATLKKLELQEKNLEERLVKIDTLRKVYNNVLLSESQSQPQSQTNIQLSSSSVKTNEMGLFELEKEINQQLVAINEERITKKNTINVIKDFSEGHFIRDFFDSYLFKIPLFCLIVLLVFIILKELNSFLNTYQRKQTVDSDS